MATHSIDSLTYPHLPALFRSGIFFNDRFASNRWQPGDADPPSPASSHWAFFSENYQVGTHRCIKPMGVWQYAWVYEYGLSTGDWDLDGVVDNPPYTSPHGQGDYAAGKAAFMLHVNASNASPGAWMVADAARKADHIVLQINYGMPWYLSSSSDTTRDAGMDPQMDFNRFGTTSQTDLEDLLTDYVHALLAVADSWAGKVRYWEIHNEPQLYNRQSPEDFCTLYEITAKAIEAAEASFDWGGADPGTYKIGGVAPTVWDHRVYEEGVGFHSIEFLRMLIDGKNQSGTPLGYGGFASPASDVPLQFLSWHAINVPFYSNPTDWGRDAMAAVRGWITGADGDPDAFDYLLTETINDGLQGFDYEPVLELYGRLNVAHYGFTDATRTAWEDWNNLDGGPTPPRDDSGEGVYHKVAREPKPIMTLWAELEKVGQMDEVWADISTNSVHGRSGTTHRVVEGQTSGAWTLQLDSASIITVTSVTRFDGTVEYPGTSDTPPAPGTSVSISAAQYEVLSVEYEVAPMSGYWQFSDSTASQALVCASLPTEISGSDEFTLLAAVRLPAGENAAIVALSNGSGNWTNLAAKEGERVRASQLGNGYREAVTTNTWTPGQWVPVAARVSGTVLQAYLDGTVGNPGSWFTPNWHTVSELVIGGNGSGSALGSFLTGDVSLPTVVQGHLSDADLDEFASGGTGGAILAPTACSWSTAADATGRVLAYLACETDTLTSNPNGITSTFTNQNGAVFVGSGGPIVDRGAATAPGQVTGVVGVSSGATSATISWDLPPSGSSPITGYRVDVRAEGGGASQPGYPVDTGSTALTYEATGLAGVSLEAVVEAENANGYGPASAASAAFTPQGITAPVAPVLAEDSHDHQSVTLTLDDPESDATAGQPIAWMRVDRRLGAGAWITVRTWNPAVTVGTWTDTQGLSPETAYDYRQVYGNSAGETASNIVAVTTDAAPAGGGTLTPGAGFSGDATASDEPGQIITGNGEDQFKVAGFYNCVPFQDVAAPFTFGVICTHRRGVDWIERVEFQADDGTTLDVAAPTLNTRTGDYEFHATIDPADYAGSGWTQIRAIGYPADGGYPRLFDFDLSSRASNRIYQLDLYVNKGTVHADTWSGGTTISAAAGELATLIAANSGDAGGVTLTLPDSASTYTLDLDTFSDYGGGDSLQRRWFTIKAQTDGGVNLAVTGTWDGHVRVDGCNIIDSQVAARAVWHSGDETDRTLVEYRKTTSGNDWIIGHVTTAPLSAPNDGLYPWHGLYITGTTTDYGQNGGGSAIGVTFQRRTRAVNQLTHDAFRNAQYSLDYEIGLATDWGAGPAHGSIGAHVSDVWQCFQWSGGAPTMRLGNVCFDGVRVISGDRCKFWQLTNAYVQHLESFWMLNCLWGRERAATDQGAITSCWTNGSTGWFFGEKLRYYIHHSALLNGPSALAGDGPKAGAVMGSIFGSVRDLGEFSSLIATGEMVADDCHLQTVPSGSYWGGQGDTTIGRNPYDVTESASNFVPPPINGLVPVGSEVGVTTLGYVPSAGSPAAARGAALWPTDINGDLRSPSATAAGPIRGADEAGTQPVASLLVATSAPGDFAYQGATSGVARDLGTYTQGDTVVVRVRLTASGDTVTLGLLSTAGQVASDTADTLDGASILVTTPQTFEITLDTTTVGASWTAAATIPNSTDAGSFSVFLDFEVQAAQTAPNTQLEGREPGGAWQVLAPEDTPITLGVQAPGGDWTPVYEIRTTNLEDVGGPDLTVSAPVFTGSNFREGSGSDAPAVLGPGGTHTTIVEALPDTLPEVVGTVQPVNNGRVGLSQVEDDPTYTFTVPVVITELVDPRPTLRPQLGPIPSVLLTGQRIIEATSASGAAGAIAWAKAGASQYASGVAGAVGGSWAKGRLVIKATGSAGAIAGSSGASGETIIDGTASAGALAGAEAEAFLAGRGEAEAGAVAGSDAKGESVLSASAAAGAEAGADAVIEATVSMTGAAGALAGSRIGAPAIIIKATASAGFTAGASAREAEPIAASCFGAEIDIRAEPAVLCGV